MIPQQQRQQRLQHPWWRWMLVIMIAGFLLHRSPPSSLAFVVSAFPILPSSAIAGTTTARTMSQNIILSTLSSTWSVDRRHQRGTKRTTTSMTGTTTTTKSKTMQLYGLPQRNHGESKEEYFRRMTQAAADPEQFARLVLTKEVVDVVPNNNSHHPAGFSSSSSSDTSDDSTTSGRRGYVRAEEWEAEQQQQMSTEKERRLQFEAQMNGDRFRQNEILQRHLNSF
jgi:hypothetical protein